MNNEHPYSSLDFQSLEARYSYLLSRGYRPVQNRMRKTLRDGSYREFTQDMSKMMEFDTFGRIRKGAYMIWN